MQLCGTYVSMPLTKAILLLITTKSTKDSFLYLRLLRVLRGKNIAVRSM